jgi:hypothetical protein
MPLEELTYSDKLAGSTNESEAKFFDAEANEIKTKTNAAINKVNELEANQINSPNPFYGGFTSLSILQTTHPTGVENAWAFIDAGAGITPQIAVWDDNEGIWEISGHSETLIYFYSFADFPSIGQINKIYIARNNYYAYVFHNNNYHRINPNGDDWRRKFVRQKTEIGNINLEDVTDDSIAAVTDNTVITHLIFGEYFTFILRKSYELRNKHNFTLNIYNVSTRSHLIALITSWEEVDDNTKLQLGISGISASEITETDTLELNLPTQTNDYIKINITNYNSLYFNTVGNVDRSKYTEGNFFKGHPTNDSYVVGKILDASDFDPFNLEKAQLFIDN